MIVTTTQGWKAFLRSSPFGLVALVACSAAQTPSASESTDSIQSGIQTNVRNIEVGTRCQQDYQYVWKDDLANVWSRCSNFQSKVSQLEVNAFYYNLHGAGATLQFPDTNNCGYACGAPDSVDFFFMETHGSAADPSSANWVMWDQGSIVQSSLLRLGNSNENNKVFATYSCDTHATDGHTVARWDSVFAGGMMITVGGRSTLYDGNPQQGTEFASRMMNSEPVIQSWLESVYYGDNDNHPAGIATGANSSDCNFRQGINFNNLKYTPLLRDNAIGYYCWSTWN